MEEKTYVDESQVEYGSDAGKTLKIDGEVGNKKKYDPRVWGAEAETGMATRVVEACQNLGSAGTSIK